MVGYVLQGPSHDVFDPAVGEGAFFRAAKVVSQELGRPVSLLGTEIDPAALEQAAASGLSQDDLASVQLQNFITHPPARRFQAIAANPPYIRHHRLPATLKADLQAFGTRLIGTALDGRAGLHVYFLLRALELLDDDGRLAFVMPADTCEGKCAPILWGWISSHYRLDAVVTFAPGATPFPAVDTNAVIFMIRKASPQPTMRWAHCTDPDAPALKQWVLSGFRDKPIAGMSVHERHLHEALRTGLSCQPVAQHQDGVILGDFATVMRGIATGENDFFFLTVARARELGIPDDFLRIAIGRTRDVNDGDAVTDETLLRLDAAGRPTRLLALGNHAVSAFPEAVQAYLRKGEDMLLRDRPLISQRHPWYKMETRRVPPILFAYLGRRRARFIRNSAGALPLTGFLCVYPRHDDPDFVNRLWKVLQHPATVANLPLVGKSYGAGAIKVEPRGLERLPLSVEALAEAGLALPPAVVQGSLF